MASTQRRLAADARRLAQEEDTKKAAASFREALRKAHSRGVEEGREQERTENSSGNTRSLMLDGAADTLDQLAARVSAIPNSHRALSAFREAGSILRDAARRGEPAQETEDDEKPKRSTTKRKAPAKAKANGKKNG